VSPLSIVKVTDFHETVHSNHILLNFIHSVTTTLWTYELTRWKHYLNKILKLCTVTEVQKFLKAIVGKNQKHMQYIRGEMKIEEIENQVEESRLR
jgi:hypothetical protein